ncbi:MAG: 50S ribosomal protein L14 [Candidatus Omnitrophica bacterium]|nr:50S ribosomal protein L14 [Candidatus Omnitrophota bacterium]
MIYLRSYLKVADNTGAKEVSCIGVIGKKNKKCANLGDVITASVKASVGEAGVRKGEVVRAVIVRTHFPIKRKDGISVKFDENACVIIDKQGNPRGTRVFGPVARETRDRFAKIISLAPEVI